MPSRGTKIPHALRQQSLWALESSALQLEKAQHRKEDPAQTEKKKTPKKPTINVSSTLKPNFKMLKAFCKAFYVGPSRFTVSEDEVLV